MAETQKLLTFQQGVQEINGAVSPVYGSSANTVTQGNDARLSATKEVRVKLNPGSGEFSSIAAAVASITDASISNPYSVRVGPGVYIEPSFTIPSYVMVIGSAACTTIIQPTTAAQHVVQMTNPNSHIKDLSVRNAGTGYAGVMILNAGPTVEMHQIDFDDCDIGVWAKTTTVDTDVLLDHIEVKGAFTAAIKVESLGGNATVIRANDIIVISAPSHTGDSAIVTGAGSKLEITASYLHGSTNDVGVRVTNGGYLACIGSIVADYATGVLADATGTNPVIELDAIDFDDNTVNFDIANATASGYFVGYTAYLKQSINASSSFFIANKSAKIITVEKKGGDFTSVKSALDSITDASANNRYVVQVGPGLFTENAITIPSYVSLRGITVKATKIVPAAATHHVVQMSAKSQLSSLTIGGAGAGYAGVAALNAGLHIRLFDASIENCDTCVYMTGTSTPTTMYVENVEIEESFATAIKLEASNSTKTKLFGKAINVFSDTVHTGPAVVASGYRGKVHLQASVLYGNHLDNGVLVSNAGYFSGIGVLIEDYVVGVYDDLIGSAAVVEIDASDFDGCTTNIQIQNSTTTGFLAGYTPYGKQSINYSAPFFITGKDPRIITVAKKGGDFTSVKSALDSITDATVSNSYQVSVGPGVFVEATIVLKPYVTVRGSGDQTTIIQASNPALPVFQAVAQSEVRDCKITGSSSVGGHGVHHEAQAGDPGGVFFLRNCLLENNYIHFHTKSSAAVTNNRIDGCRIIDADSGTYAFYCESTMGFPCGLNITNFLLRDFTTPYIANFLKVTGPDAEARVLASTIRASGLGKAFWVADGARLNMYGCEVSAFDYGIWAENVGAAPQVDVLGVDSDCATWDLKVDHPGTIGHYNGSADQSKIYIDPAAQYRVDILDPNPSAPFGNIILGDVGTGNTYSKLFNLTRLVTHTATFGLISGGTLTKGAGLNLNVSLGSGFCEDASDNIVELNWGAQSIVMPASASRYVYFNYSGTLSLSSSLPSFEQAVLLGRVSTNATDVEYIERAPMLAYHSVNANAKFFRTGLGAVYSSGSAVAEVGTRQLNIGSGQYYFAGTEFNPSGANPATYDAYYRDGGTGFTEITGVTTVDNANYDSGTGTLTPLTATYYAKHALYLVGDGANEEYIFVYSQTQYSSLVLAEGGNLPLPPAFIDDSIVLIASIIVQQGTAPIVEIRDERPVIGFKASGVSAATTHGNLLGLSADDHPQYLLVNGIRAMSSSLNMGTNNITNVGTVDGVDVSAHASRHLPTGADPIATAAAVEITDATNGAGTSNTALARADHVHAHGNRGGGSLHAVATTSVNGFMSSADKTKLDGISGARPLKSGLVAAGSFAGNPKKYAVVFGAAFADANYTVAISGVDSRAWSYESKTAAGFTINTNANAALTGEVSWTCISTGETLV